MEWMYFSFAALSLCSLALLAAGAIASFRFFRAPASAVVEGAHLEPGISLLKPLKGVDAATRRNLESFFWLSYPKFELLFCVAEEGDPAVALVRELLAAYPEVNARLFVGEIHAGANPKINNLLSGYGAARYEIVLVSDSNIRVLPGYLSEMMSGFAGQQMISSVVVGQEATSFTGSLEEIFLGGFYARAMVLSLQIGTPCMMGKSMMFRREAMERVGGLAALSPYLAEDFMAGELFRKAGYPISISPYVVSQVIGSPRLGEFWRRHVRWGRIRKVHAPLLFLVEPFFTNLPVGAAFFSLAAAHLTPLPAFTAAAAYVAAWLAFDALSLVAGGGRLSVTFPLQSLARELLHLPLWVHIASGNEIRWKSGRWRLGRDGRLTELSSNGRPELVSQGGMAALPPGGIPLRPQAGPKATR